MNDLEKKVEEELRHYFPSGQVKASVEEVLAIVTDAIKKVPITAPLAQGQMPVGHQHPETAQKMKTKVFPNFGTQRMRIFEFIFHMGDIGATDDDLEIGLKMAHQSASAGRNTLMKDGWIVDSGRERRNRYDNDAIIWVVSDEGRREYVKMNK